MSFKEFLYESPQMVDPTSFQLDDKSKNQKFAKELISKRKEIVIDSTDYQVFRTGNLIDGYIVMINLDKPDDTQIKYLVNYKAKNFKSNLSLYNFFL